MDHARRPRGAATDLASLRRPGPPVKPVAIMISSEQTMRLLKGIRPELEQLQPLLPQAGNGMIRGVPLTDMSRDELLAVAAMFCMREAERSATPPDEAGEDG